MEPVVGAHWVPHVLVAGEAVVIDRGWLIIQSADGGDDLVVNPTCSGPVTSTAKTA